MINENFQGIKPGLALERPIGKPEHGYCGVDPFLTGPEDPFNPACKQHDIAYENRSPNRLEADRLFFKQMDEIAKQSPNRPLIEIRKSIYKLLVLIFGPLFYAT